MKKLLGALAVSVWIPCAAVAATWENASLIDTKCAAKVHGDPDKHPTSCLLKCADHGYGIQTSDGKFMKLDDAGNKLAVGELRRTSKKDSIRVNVQGDTKGDVIQVTSLKISD